MKHAGIAIALSRVSVLRKVRKIAALCLDCAARKWVSYFPRGPYCSTLVKWKPPAW
jgi:hypothetical protein